MPKNSFYEAFEQQAQKVGNNIQSPEEFYKNFDGESYYNTKIDLPKGPIDMAVEGEPSWGKPQDWDYQTAKTGWKGEELPEGAKSWKPDGTPYYGGDNAFQEWWNALQYKISAPAERSSKESFAMSKQLLKNKDVPFWQRALGGAVTFFEGLGNIGLEEGEAPETRLTKASRWTGQLLTGAGYGLGRVAEVYEQEVASRIQALEDIGDAGGVFKGGESIVDRDAQQERVQDRLTQWTNPVLANNATKAMRFLGELADVVVPMQVGWNAIRAVVSPLSLQEKKDIIAERVESSKILYTTFIEPAKKQQYLDRVRNGEDPYLVSVELQNPWAEMGGQAILDPLNVLGWVAKGSGVAKSIRSYGEYMAKPIGAFGEFFTKGANKLLQFDEGQDITRMAEAWIQTRKTARGLVGSMAVELNVEGGGALGKVRPLVNKALERSGIFGWSQSGKRHHLQRVTSDMMNIILKTAGKDPDEPLFIIKNMVRLQSDDVMEVAEAMAELGGSAVPLNMLTSEGGMRFGAVMREMMLDADGVVNGQKFIDKFGELSDDLPGLVDWLNGKIDNVAKDLFPDLSKRADVLGKIEKGTELTKAELLIDATPLSTGEKFFLKAEQIANNKLLTGVNRFFANVYMGLSPGYAFRNLFTNELHVLVDLGPAKYIESWARFNPTNAMDNLVYMTRDTVGQMAVIGVGQGGEGKLFGQKLAGTFEKWGGQKLYGMAYKDTLDKMVPVVVEEVSKRMKVAGATDEQIALYKSVVNMTYGRFDEASEVLRQGMKTGQINTFNLGGWIPDEMMKFFDQADMGPQIRQIVRQAGDDKEQVLKQIRVLFNDAKKQMKRTEGMFSHPARMDGEMLDGLEHYQDYQNTLENFIMSGDTKQASKHAGMANQNADEYFRQVLSDTRRLAGEQGIDLDFSEFGESAETLMKILDGDFYEPHYDNFRTKYLNPIKHWVYETKVDPKKIRNAWGAMDFLPNDAMPKNMSAQQFADLIYEVILPSESRKYFAPLRDIHSFGAETIKRYFEKKGVKLTEANIKMWEQAGEALKHAQAYDTHVIRNISWDELGRATGDVINNVSLTTRGFDDLMDIKTLGIVNGISSVFHDPKTNRKIPTNDLLKAINNGLEQLGHETYQHLDDVPYHRAKQALAKYRGEKFQPIKRLISETQIDIPDPFFDMFTEAKVTKAVTKTSDMDQRVADLMKYQADLFKHELDGSIGGGSIWTPNERIVPGSAEAEVVGSTKWGAQYPEWYKKAEVGGSSAYYKGEKGRKAVIKALEALGKGEDGDEAIMVRLRQALLNRIERGTPEDFIEDLRASYRAYAPLPSEVDDMIGFVDDARDVGLVELQDEFGRLTGEWGFDIEDEFWNPTLSVSAPETLSDPHAYLALGPEMRNKEVEFLNLIDQNFGKIQDTYENPQLIEALKGIDEFTNQQETVIRATANEYGTHMRNFGLVNYDSRRNIDTLTGMVMPYQFWYGRTYSNWAQRVIRDPSIVANYYRYKQAMAESHAGLPEFWQNNINSAELLGLWKDHPIFFNLEATLNPLQGLTGTDFEDPRKRVDGWSQMVDDLNRFGPSTHPIFNYALAFAYMLKGEGEASSRWGGRLIPQTATFNALASIMGWEEGTAEVDPAVWLFSGGIDPYMRRRVGRAFPQMIAEGMLTDEQAIDAVWSQDGPYWESARQRAVGERAWGQLASFFLGVGFKGRNQGDIQTDRMYDDFYSLMNRRVSMSPDQFKQSMNYLQQKYPFMDSVLISAKTGEARDMAFAYSVLSRIAPGDNNRLLEMVDVDPRLVQKFYDSRGDFEGWAQSDKNRFMAGVIDLNAILAIPDNMTAQTWTNSRARYSQITQAMTSNFGEGIHEEINHFYALKNAGQDEDAEAFLQSNPQVEKAMQWKLDAIINDETGFLKPYYVSINKIESYYFGKMYGEAKKRFGENIFDVQGEYFSLESSREKKQFIREHPELKEYWDFRDDAGKEANQHIVDMTSNLPQGIEQPFREDIGEGAPVGIGGQDLQEGLSQPEDPFLQVQPNQWAEMIGDKDFGAVYEYLEDGESFTFQEKTRLRGVAENLGIDLDRMVQYIGVSLNQNEEYLLPNNP